MEKSIFERDGGTYTRQGDYLLPDLSQPEQPEYEIGVWSSRRRQFLREHHRIKYYNMLTDGTLYPHLAEVERRAQDMFMQLVDELAEKEGVTEKLKANDMMVWVRKMNNIRNRIEEIINAELIYT